MSDVEYNSLIFEISQRLDELNVRRKLIVMCRGKAKKTYKMLSHCSKNWRRRNFWRLKDWMF